MPESKQETEQGAEKSAPRRPFLSRLKPSGSRVPEDSFFYTKLIPVLIITLGVIMVALIILAAGVLLGFVPFR